MLYLFWECLCCHPAVVFLLFFSREASLVYISEELEITLDIESLPEHAVDGLPRLPLLAIIVPYLNERAG